MSTAFPLELKGPKEVFLRAPQFVDETTLPKTSALTRKVFTDTINTPAPGEAIELYQKEVKNPPATTGTAAERNSSGYSQ